MEKKKTSIGYTTADKMPQASEQNLWTISVIKSFIQCCYCVSSATAVRMTVWS
jgi:hypothetical protein